MIRKSTYVICSVLLIVVLGNATFHNTSLTKHFRKPYNIAFPPQGYTGTTSGQYCNAAGCHNSFTLNSGGGNITASGLPASYKPGTAYNFSITVKHGTADRKRWGFSIAARNSAGQTVGTFSTTNANAGVNGTELSHLNAVVTIPQSSFTYNNLTWTAPVNPGVNDGSITFYYAGVAANSDVSSLLDYVYTSTAAACWLPAQPSKITGASSVCSGSTKTYDVTPVAGATSYKWSVPSGAKISGPKTGTSVKVIWGSTGGDVVVKAVNSCGSSKGRGKAVTVDCLTAGNGSVEEESATAAKLVTAKVFPNPSHGNLTLQFEGAAAAGYTIEITDMVGKAVMNLQGTSIQGLNTVNLNLSRFEKGVYIIQLQLQNGGTTNRKIVLE